MRSFKIGVAAAAIMCALSVTAEAGSCMRVGAIGDGLTHDLAVVMSTHGLANIIENKGLKGKGPIHTACSQGAVLTECRSSQTACK
jgi:hypothetical protein